ncbi:uncharacterized protein LOC142978443 [Anticarsia gemmatalis]|uniref:uncharacterized protein LOC142978443 n=1 Tax=Anticarsia gemmatalis TaxID=129554 RepID=UPI003F773335
MSLYVILFVLIVGSQVFLSSSQEATTNKMPMLKTLFPNLKYPQSYRDHVYRHLTKNGKDIFYATNIHPLCAKKDGRCMRRGECKTGYMLYISRVCYRHDFICCYDHRPVRPLIGPARTRPSEEDFTNMTDNFPQEYPTTIFDDFTDYNNTATFDYVMDDNDTTYNYDYFNFKFNASKGSLTSDDEV